MTQQFLDDGLKRKAETNHKHLFIEIDTSEIRLREDVLVSPEEVKAHRWRDIKIVPEEELVWQRVVGA